MSDMIVDACGAMGVMKVVILSRVPQRPMSGSVGLVVESARRQDYLNAFEWFCFHCGARVHRIEIKVMESSRIYRRCTKPFTPMKGADLRAIAPRERTAAGVG
jgi:hypothetical protein